MFIADEQKYDYKKVKVVKTKKQKKGFNMDDMQLGDEKKPEPVPNPEPAPQEQNDTAPQQPETQATKTDQADHTDPKKPVTRERSVDELSMSDDDSPPAKKAPVKTAYVPKDKKDEKPGDVFKNMYSEFKEYIPSKDKKPETAAATNKPGFMQKARGFFGL